MKLPGVLDEALDVVVDEVVAELDAGLLVLRERAEQRVGVRVAGVSELLASSALKLNSMFDWIGPNEVRSLWLFCQLIPAFTA